jgi:hypothetical protein
MSVVLINKERKKRVLKCEVKYAFTRGGKSLSLNH